MQQIIYGFLSFMLVVTVYRALRTTRPTSLVDYYSFGISANEKYLFKSFFVTNASFSTAFVSLFLFGMANGALSVWTPFGFFIGVLAYAKIFLPKILKLATSGERYVSLLFNATKSRTVHALVTLYVILSLWLFTYAEIQGFIALSSDSNTTPSSLSLFFGILICLTMAFYIYKSGLRGIIASDNIQFWAITLGAGCLLIGSLILFFSAVNNDESFSSFFSSVYPLSSIKIRNIATAGIESIAGFLFSQILYYDNWQRIDAYIQRREPKKDPEAPPSSQTQEEIMRAY